MKSLQKHSLLMSIICLGISTVIAVMAGLDFYSFRHYQEIIKPGSGVTETFQLSQFNKNLTGTFGDTTVYVMKGKKEGGSLLVLGGTHPNEPSGHMAAITLIESGQIDAGTVYVIPRTNNSAFTHNDSQEASIHFYHFTTASGVRTFVYGSRATNPLDQWPDPDVYIHKTSGQTLSGSETRNLNRAYPGVADGNLSEEVAYAITTMVQSLNIDMEVDLHEASPEYPTINATVAHERAMMIASQAILELNFEGIEMSLEPSPVKLHGLTHRELGDYTNTLALLMETGNASQGRLRGRSSEALVLTGKDKFYTWAAKLGFVYIPYDDSGVSIETRVGRHLQGIIEFTKAFTDQEGKAITISGIPTYEDLQSSDLGKWLN